MSRLYRRDRFRHWLAEKILGGHVEDEWEGCWKCRFKPPLHDIVEHSPLVIDMDPVLAEIGAEGRSAFLRGLEHGERKHGAQITHVWMDEWSE